MTTETVVKPNEAELSEPRPFAFVPEDMKPEQKGRFLQDQVQKMFEDQGRRGWEPEGGVSRAQIQVQRITGIPPYHTMYKEGHETWIVREKRFHLHWDDPNATHTDKITGRPYRVCNRIRFKRVARSGVMWLPDSIAHALQKEGKFKVLEWDDKDFVPDETPEVETSNKERVSTPVEW